MVNKPLIRPAISGGGTLGGGRLTSHDMKSMNVFHQLPKIVESHLINRQHVALSLIVFDFFPTIVQPGFAAKTEG